MGAILVLSEQQKAFLARFVGRGWLHGIRENAEEQVAVDLALRKRWLKREMREMHFTPKGRTALAGD